MAVFYAIAVNILIRAIKSGPRHLWPEKSLAERAGTTGTKSVYAPREHGDGLRVLVTRFYPRGVKKGHFDRWARELAPSPELLGEYRDKKITWGEFADCYRAEIQGNPENRNMMAELRTIDATLLCYEPEGTPCHRHLLREVIQNPRLLGANFTPEYADGQAVPARRA